MFAKAQVRHFSTKITRIWSTLLVFKLCFINKFVIAQMVRILKPEPVLSQTKWSLTQTGCVFPQTWETNGDVMLLCVVYLTITSVKTNIAHPCICAGSVVLSFHSIGSDSSVHVNFPYCLLSLWERSWNWNCWFTRPHTRGSLSCAKSYIFRNTEECSAARPE